MQSLGVIDHARPIILVFIRYYLPGDKSGGPVRSIVNIVAKLSDEFDFRIVTSDRDWTDENHYEGIVVDTWNQVGKAQVFYLSPKNRTLRFIAKLLSVTHYDVLYLNSFFDPDFTQKPLWVRKLGLAAKKPLIIAPRGEFSAGAFSLKYWKKAFYVWIFEKIKLVDNIIWHASTEDEVLDIRCCLSLNKQLKIFSKTIVALDISSDMSEDITKYNILNNSIVNENSNVLRIIFISRISPKKNLDFALRVLAQVNVPIEFNIYGPHDGDEYWELCKTMMEKLPKNLTARYAGVLPHSEVMNIFRSHDLFLFPTLGENYGHVIMESLLAGTPVLIANTTPWKNLENHGVGWDLPLDNEFDFVEKIHISAEISNEKRRKWRQQVFLYAKTIVNDPKILQNNRKLFRFAVELGT